MEYKVINQDHEISCECLEKAMKKALEIAHKTWVDETEENISPSVFILQLQTDIFPDTGKYFFYMSNEKYHLDLCHIEPTYPEIYKI